MTSKCNKLKTKHIALVQISEAVETSSESNSVKSDAECSKKLYDRQYSFIYINFGFPLIDPLALINVQISNAIGFKDIP